MFLTAAVKLKSHSQSSHFPTVALRSAEDVRHQQQSTIHGKTGSLGGIRITASLISMERKAGRQQ